MFWAQAAIALLVWLAYGYLLYRKSRQILKFVLAIPRKKKAILAPSFLLMGLIALGSGVALVEVFGGFQQNQVAWMGWLSIVVVGLFFVRTQVLAAAMMATLGASGVTNAPQSPSVSRESTNEDK